ncbi:MAG: fatty acid desaturase, partial [Leptospira sp.]|nr:fatty acid desaturase [Leptospira sp.]
MKAIAPYYISLTLILSWLIGMVYGGWSLSLVAVLAFVILPVVDIWFGVETSNVSEGSFVWRQNHLWLFDLIFYIYIPLQTLMILMGPWFVLHNRFNTIEFVFSAVSAGLITGGLGITIAHELCHRKNGFQRFLADFLLSSVCYMHFSTEHVYGHHNHVSTFEDPASARFGESFFAFYPRTVKGTFLSAWRIEAKKRLGKNLKVLSLGN